MNLYRVSFRRIYGIFYVEAYSFDDAATKLLAHLKLNESKKYKVHDDGLVELIVDLEKGEEARSSYVNEIELVTSLIIR